jgi:Spy/CpxP family protein refolding chaperone
MKTPLALALFAAAVSFAQPPSGAPAFTELKTYLNLSDTQITSITAANSAARTANRTLADQAHTKQQALQTAIANGSNDAAAIGKAVLEIAAIRKQLAAAHTKLREQATSFLSADQKTKLKALEDAEKLRPAIGQAHALELLAAPTGGPGQRGPGTGGPGRRHFGNGHE